MPFLAARLNTALVLASLAVAGSALAQTTPPSPPAPPANPPVPAQPNAVTPPGGVPRGVVPPPGGVDPGMVSRPAPSAGTMPVITPPGTAR